MTVVAAQGMIPCRINERRCLIVIYKFYWSLPGVIVTISGENKTNYTHHTTASSQPITNGKSLSSLNEDGGEKVFFSCRQNVSIDVPKYIYAKSSWTSYRLQKYRYYITCIVYAYLQHVCKQISCEFFYSFIWQVSEAFASVDISISVSMFPSLSCHEIFTVLVLGCCWLGVAKCGSLSLC